jgi:hypothetical protein
MGMLNKATFTSDDSLNAFFRINSHNGQSAIYLIKIIILYSQVSKQLEYHIIYSDNNMMKSGQHHRMGVNQ